MARRKRRKRKPGQPAGALLPRHFDSPHALAVAIKVAKVKGCEDPAWAGATRDEARDMLEGRHVPAIDKEAMLDRVRSLIPDVESFKREWRSDCWGSRVNVPRALAGNPLSFRRMSRREAPQPVRVFLSLSCGAGVTPAYLVERAAAIAALVDVVRVDRPVDVVLYTHLQEDPGLPRVLVTCRIPPGDDGALLSMSHPGTYRQLILSYAMKEYETETGRCPWGVGGSHDVPDAEALGAGEGDLVIGRCDYQPNGGDVAAWLEGVLQGWDIGQARAQQALGNGRRT